MHISADKTKFEIDVTWVEQIAHMANEICDKSDYDRIKMNEQNTGFIIEYNDAGALGCIGWEIERYIDDIPSKLKLKFKKILDDTKTKKTIWKDRNTKK